MERKEGVCVHARVGAYARASQRTRESEACSNQRTPGSVSLRNENRKQHLDRATYGDLPTQAAQLMVHCKIIIRV